MPYSADGFDSRSFVIVEESLVSFVIEDVDFVSFVTLVLQNAYRRGGGGDAIHALLEQVLIVRVEFGIGRAALRIKQDASVRG